MPIYVESSINKPLLLSQESGINNDMVQKNLFSLGSLVSSKPQHTNPDNIPLL